ncbi:MAG: DUF4381 domain-containing protein [Pseudomonadota bacterium]|nr:DUF4381 domain-containing protein [Pseudomonadota bacterium]
MNDPLSQLKDIHIPDPVGWWPMAFSWWVLLFSVSAILFALIWFLLDRHKRNAYRREASDKLKQIKADHNIDNQQKILQINALLKQVAITVYGRQKISELNEQAWLDFLKSSANFITQPQELTTLLSQAYQPLESLDEADLQRKILTWQSYAHQWIKGHHL